MAKIEVPPKKYWSGMEIIILVACFVVFPVIFIVSFFSQQREVGGPRAGTGNEGNVVMEKGPVAPEGMVFVEGGTFEMGSSDGDGDEKPVHRVTVKSFYMDNYEVTVKQYREFCRTTGRTMPAAPEWGWNDNDPIVNVSWDDAAAYAKWAGRRLPSEAEWEYAARGGKLSKGHTFGGSNNLEDVGWHDGNSGNRAHPVGQKMPNELGLYDISGNVWEWCADWYGEDYYRNSPSRNPTGSKPGQYRVLRGGSWYNNVICCRVANRNRYFPGNRNYFIGFRCVKDMEGKVVPAENLMKVSESKDVAPTGKSQVPVGMVFVEGGSFEMGSND